MLQIEQRTIGMNFYPKPHIHIWAPFAKKLSVVFENGNEIILHQESKGYWYANCPEVKEGDRYKLKINDKDTFPDPNSLAQPQGVHEFSECIDLNKIRKIEHKAWKGIATEDLVIYELHIGTFSPKGTFDGAKEKLDHLCDLGINAIKVMPVASFPGNRNWGYDGVFPFSVQNSYGGAYEFANFVKSCHKKGLAVILDVVYNHLGPEGNYMGSFGPFFTTKYTTPWGKAINFDDAWCDGVRHFFLDNALMWLRDFHVDGLRLDAVHAIKDLGPKHFLAELREKVEALNEETHSRHFLIAECDLNDTRYITAVNKGGLGMNSQWCDEWHHSIHALLTQEKTGYYSEFGSPEYFVKSMNDAYVYTGEYSEHRKKHFGTPTLGFPGDSFIIFTQNHDQVGNRLNGDRLSTMLDFETLKLAAGAMLLAPYTPMIFMGEEYAEDSPFLYFISHGDPHLVEMVRKGRKREFRDFIKNANPPDPAAEETFLKSKLKWDFEKTENKNQIFHFYKELIAFRKKFSVLKNRKRKNFSALLSKDKKSVFLKYTGKDQDDLGVVLNISSDKISLKPWMQGSTLPQLLLYSCHEKWGGSVENDFSPISKAPMEIMPKSFIVFH